MVKITPELVNSVQHLRIDHNFGRFVEHMQAMLEDAKADLVEAPQDVVPKLQGRALALKELLALVAVAPHEPRGVSF